MNATELNWELHGLRYAGMAWGDPARPPLLALHGWLDNAASFARLAPTLAQRFYVVAPDLSGHGRSEWRSADATYHVYDDVPQLHELVAQMQWDQFHLMGHSRGAAISVVYAAAFPEQVKSLTLLDGAIPTPLDEAEFTQQLRRFVHDKKRLLGRKSRVYAERSAAVTAREEQGLERDEAELIASRNLYECEGGYTWRTDPRLRGASAMKLTKGQVQALLGALTMPTLLVTAENGMVAANPEYMEKVESMIPTTTRASFAGSHHFHMEAAAAEIGQRVVQFIETEVQ